MFRARIRSAPAGHLTSLQGLTHTIRCNRMEGLAMKATHKLPEARKPRTPITIPDRVAIRALSRWTLEAPTGCHVSTYSTGSHGYAQLGWMDPGDKRSTMTLAHRAAWTAMHGPIPEGMTIDHLCKNRRCVNIEHLRMLTNYENARRTSGRDWPLGRCLHGHSNEHLVNWSGRWHCRICAGDWQRAYRARQASLLRSTLDRLGEAF